MDDTYKIQPDQNVQTFEMPTGRLRWHQGVLQQEWHVERHEPNHTSSHFEYRDVPTDDED